MAQKPIELILLKELASQLAMAVTLVDNEENVVFYNQPAEALLGLRYEETGELPYARFVEMYGPTDSDGLPIPVERLPLGIALRKRRPQQGSLWIRNADGTARRIAATSIPLDGQGGVPLGAMSIFWEVDAS